MLRSSNSKSQNIIAEEMNLNIDETLHKRNPVLKEALSPILFLLKVFGLYYENDMTPKEGRGCMKTLTMIYGYGIFFVLLYSLSKSVAALFYQDSDNGYYLAAVFAVYNFKCLGQSFACLKMSSRRSKNILRDFIDRVETLLTQIKLCNCRIAERRFKRRLRIWLYVFAIILISINALTIFIAIHKSNDFELYNNITAFPMPVTTWSFTIKMFIDIYNYSAFFLPTALCGVLTQSLAYTFDEYYRYLRYRKKEEGLCMRKNIKEIREHFVTLTTLCCDLDDMMAWIFMISYLIDIILICLLLRVGVYSFTDILGRLAIVMITVPPTFSLLTLSHYSSRLIDKGQEMSLHIQKLDISNVDMDTKIELDLLLFHLNSEPVVLTIWKMVPLYKSVIISIFVSIITYFTLMITF